MLALTGSESAQQMPASLHPVCHLMPLNVQVAEETAKKIEAAAAAYKACSLRAAILYFVLNDLSNTDPMYQFSLDAYVDLFLISIQKSAKNDKVEDRIKNLNEYHTYAVYKYTAR